MCTQCHEREAVVRLTQVQEDQVVTLRLCERCAAERGVDTGVGQPANLLGGFLAALGEAADAPEETGAGAGSTCPGCGATLDDFRASGRLGCATCWDTFAAALVPLVRRLHGSTHHAGVAYWPPGAPAMGQAAERKRLSEQLEMAIATENFELAAEIRDRLKQVSDD